MHETNRRILIVDDNAAIHADFAKILGARTSAGSFAALAAAFFDADPVATSGIAFELAFAKQGQDALVEVVAARAADRPFALAFVDMRMPPGWDGLATIEQLWAVEPDLQIVICSAYSDYSWHDIHARLGDRDALLIVKKPFDTVEVIQCALALTEKWNLARRAHARMDELEDAVRERTVKLVELTTRLAGEIERRDRVEAELRLAQKLEAIGQLAAGIAHELNTPIQYVGDSLQFIRDATTDLVEMARQLQSSVLADSGESTGPLIARFQSIVEAADLQYLSNAVPGALARIHSGVARITTIVRAMKDLSHPGDRDATAVDVNHLVNSSLEVASNIYKYVADLDLHLGALPPVICLGGELSQVFLNLIVNATHAMENQGSRGTLGVRTELDGELAVITISDTGAGIPEAIRDRIFDAFFTTKEVGKGTGQGLAISRSIIVDRHGGTLTFDSTVGVGTTFRIRLPIAGIRVLAAA